eukprot:g30605.t1
MAIEQVAQGGCVVVVVVGAQLGHRMSATEALVAVVLGNGFLAVICMVVGAIGCREGLTTSLLARWTGFGVVGSQLLSFIVSWFGIQAAIAGEGLHTITSGITSLQLSWPWTALNGFLVTLVAAFGFRYIVGIAWLTGPAFLVAVVWALWRVEEAHDAREDTQRMSVGEGTNLVVGGYIVGSVIVSDAFRFSRSKRQVVSQVLLPRSLAIIGYMLAGVQMARMCGTDDVIQIMKRTVGLWAVVVVVAGEMVINCTNLYFSGLALVAIGEARVEAGRRSGEVGWGANRGAEDADTMLARSLNADLLLNAFMGSLSVVLRSRGTGDAKVTCVKIVARIVETARVALAELDEAKDKLLCPACRASQDACSACQEGSTGGSDPTRGSVERVGWEGCDVCLLRWAVQEMVHRYGLAEVPDLAPWPARFLLLETWKDPYETAEAVLLCAERQLQLAMWQEEEMPFCAQELLRHGQEILAGASAAVRPSFPSEAAAQRVALQQQRDHVRRQHARMARALAAQLRSPRALLMLGLHSKGDLTGIEATSENLPIVALACQCIAGSATTSDSVTSFARAGVLDEVLNVMDSHKSHGGVQNVALFLLRTLLKDSGAARQAVQNGAIARVLHALNLSMGREIQRLHSDERVWGSG